jgi:hypothetical protein
MAWRTQVAREARFSQKPCVWMWVRVPQGGQVLYIRKKTCERSVIGLHGWLWPTRSGFDSQRAHQLLLNHSIVTMS